MFKKIGQLFGGDPFQRKIDSLKIIVDQINALESTYEALTDAELAAKTGEFKQRLEAGETLDDLLVKPLRQSVKPANAPSDSVIMMSS